MKSFVVEWDDEATRMLADIYVNSADPDSLWPAQDKADRLLESSRATSDENSPKACGKSSFRLSESFMKSTTKNGSSS